MTTQFHNQNKPLPVQPSLRTDADKPSVEANIVMETEIWKSVLGSEGLYEISTFGRIKSLPKKYNGSIKNLQGTYTKEKTLKPIWNKVNNVFYYSIRKNNSKKFSHCSIQQLVATHFIPNPNNLPQVNHIDGDRSNNNISNLEWMTDSDNKKHAYKIGLKKPYWKGKTGKESPAYEYYLKKKQVNFNKDNNGTFI